MVFMAFPQRDGERGQTPAHVRLHGSSRDTHGGGYLAFGQVEPVPQDDRLASSRRQARQRGQHLAVVFPEHGDLLGGVLVVPDGGPQPDHTQVAVPVSGQVADAGPHVGERGVRVA
jgi:hypothetical protein